MGYEAWVQTTTSRGNLMNMIWCFKHEFSFNYENVCTKGIVKSNKIKTNFPRKMRAHLTLIPAGNEVDDRFPETFERTRWNNLIGRLPDVVRAPLGCRFDLVGASSGIRSRTIPPRCFRSVPMGEG